MNNSFTVETAKIVGVSADGCWSQIHTYLPEEGEKLKKRGYLMAVLVIDGVLEGVEAVAVGREIISRLHEEYFGNLEDSAFTRLKKSVEKLCFENKGLQLIGASVIDNVLSVSICGNGKILLKRGDKFGLLLEGEGKEKTVSASGLLSPDDFFLLASEKIFKVVAGGVLRAAFDSNSPTEAVEVLAPIVLGREGMSDAVAVIALIKGEDQMVSIPSVSETTEEPERQFVLEAKREEPAEEFQPKISIFEKILKLFRPPNRRTFFVHREGESKRLKLLFVIPAVLAFVCLIILLTFKQKIFFQDKAVENNMIQPMVEEVNKRLEVALTEVPVLLDLGTDFSDANFTLVTKIDKKVAIFDQNKKNINLFVDKKSTEIKIGAETNFLAIFKDKLFALTEDGIIEAKSTDKQGKTVVKNDSSSNEVVGLGVFNGNLYLLDRGNNNLWRYQLSGNSYLAKKSWLKEEVDFTGATSFAVDGSIWVLFKDKIEKYSLGKKDGFSLNNFSEGFSATAKIFTSEKEQNLYVFDREKGKIYVFSKSGEYKTAYVWEELKKAVDFFVSEEEGKIYLLSGQKIYGIGLR